MQLAQCVYKAKRKKEKKKKLKQQEKKGTKGEQRQRVAKRRKKKKTSHGQHFHTPCVTATEASFDMLFLPVHPSHACSLVGSQSPVTPSVASALVQSRAGSREHLDLEKWTVRRMEPGRKQSQSAKTLSSQLPDPLGNHWHRQIEDVPVANNESGCSQESWRARLCSVVQRGSTNLRNVTLPQLLVGRGQVRPITPWNI